LFVQSFRIKSQCLVTEQERLRVRRSRTSGHRRAGFIRQTYMSVAWSNCLLRQSKRLRGARRHSCLLSPVGNSAAREAGPGTILYRWRRDKLGHEKEISGRVGVGVYGGGWLVRVGGWSCLLRQSRGRGFGSRLDVRLEPVATINHHRPIDPVQYRGCLNRSWATFGTTRRASSL
jgi:hypothetical protein